MCKQCNCLTSEATLIRGGYLFGYAENVVVQPAANRTSATSSLTIFGNENDPSQIYDYNLLAGAMGELIINLFDPIPGGLTLQGSFKNITQNLYNGNAIIAPGDRCNYTFGGGSLAINAGDVVKLFLFVDGSSPITIPRLTWYTT